MKLRTLRIVNFRCCKDVFIEVGAMHALVGANNAGKSTILKAIDFLFNPSTTKLSKEAFWKGEPKNEIYIEGLFIELNDHEKEIFEPYLKPDGTFHLRRTASVKNGEEDEEDMKFEIGQFFNQPTPKYDWLVDEKIKLDAIAEWKKEPDKLVVNDKSVLDYVGTKATAKAWKEAAQDFIEKHLTDADFQDEWRTNPQGFPSVLKSNLPHFELIPAVRDASDESKVLKTNPFGRLIYEIIRNIDEKLKDEIGAQLKLTTKKLNRDAKEHRVKGIAQIENSMNGYLRELMKGSDLEIEFPAPTIETLLTAPKIHVNDGFRGSIDGKGHGLQRAVIFSILRCYANLVTTKKDKGKRTLILGIEEPELYMHPTAQRTIRRVFRTIADGGDQVLFSTQSPLLVDVTYFDEIIRVESEEETVAKSKDEHGARIFQLSMEALIQDEVARHPHLKGKVQDGSMRELYAHAYSPSRNEGFFAKRVILVEGPTETYCLPIYAAAMNHELDLLGVAVVDCNGKEGIDRLYRIFNELGIACFVLFDYDKGNDDAVANSKKVFKLVNHDAESTDKAICTRYFACFLEKWETDLHKEIPEIQKLLMAAGQFLGPTGKPLKERFVAMQLTQKAPAFIPPSLQKIITSAIQVPRHGTCLQKSE